MAARGDIIARMPQKTTYPHKITRKTPTNRSPQLAQSSWFWPVVAFFAFLIGLGVGYLAWGKAAGELAALKNGTGETQRYDVSVDDDPAYGPDDAAVTIIEFSDYQCPFCKRWHDEVWSFIKEEYGDQVRLVYRDFPLPNHPEAKPAALAANCADEQDQYWVYHQLLFQDLASLGNDLYLAYAQQAGLDVTAFSQCLSENRYLEEIEADAAYAKKMGVSSTPTFFVNGIPMIGAQPYAAFKQLIDQELAAAGATGEQ